MSFVSFRWILSNDSKTMNTKSKKLRKEYQVKKKRGKKKTLFFSEKKNGKNGRKTEKLVSLPQEDLLKHLI